MNTTRILGLSALALALAIPTAQAEDRAKLEAARQGEHPAVIVARRGVQVDPNSKFYLHPARLSWSLQRLMSDGAPPDAVVAGRGVQADQNPKLNGVGGARPCDPAPQLGAGSAARKI